MALVKVIKNKAYSKRFQVQKRRRRKGKTDYYARKRLVTQDKRKYDAPKYRLVVRLTSKDIIAQVAAARIVGDEMIAVAYSHELPQYGIKLGLTNYAAAYATGLLLARRTLKKLGLDETYVGKEEADGEMFEIEVNDERRPFTAILDVGIGRTTTGSKIFAVMKGAVDGGIQVPHNEKRFPAFSKDDGFDPEELRKRILGLHVQEYMEYLVEEDDEKYKQQFARYIAEGIEPDSIEDLYKSAHEKIRENPVFVKKPKKEYDGPSPYKQPKISREQRQQNVREKLARLMAEAEAGDDE
uniref:Large ribosomal subunit protein uL18 C-terminal eukaryotes domain-containing protein n=1 Tax=Compsopogon caeruleus TaxID=31354 RepID=A0A7S1T5J7_9RHOD|mmetsp:Transcript_11095/g.22104  ORF Transcript_11095/g.22104 Transcript_11095/m.22104 type:complete len:297 (+) Transcript_11095:55-945(+)